MNRLLFVVLLCAVGACAPTATKFAGGEKGPEAPKSSAQTPAPPAIPPSPPIVPAEPSSAPLPLPVAGDAPEIDGTAIDGTAFKLSACRGRVVLISFWATWCGPCRAEIPHEKGIHKHYHGRPFQMVGIACDKTQQVAEVRKFVRGMDWPQIHDGRGTVAQTYKVASLPTFVLIDKNGNVAGRWSGGGHSVEIQTAIDRCLQ